MTVNNFSNSIIQTATFQLQQSNLASQSNVPTGRTEGEIDAIAQDFEAVFLSQVINTLFEGVETNELFGGGHGEETFKQFLFDEYGKTLASAGGIGVADGVKRSLLTFQEV